MQESKPNEQSNSTKPAREELYSSNPDATRPDNSEYSELIKQRPLDDSFLTLIHNPKQGWFIALGTKRLTDFYEDEESAIIATEGWPFMLTLMSAVAVDTYQHYDKNEHTK